MGSLYSEGDKPQLDIFCHRTFSSRNRLCLVESLAKGIQWKYPNIADFFSRLLVALLNLAFAEVSTYLCNQTEKSEGNPSYK